MGSSKRPAFDSLELEIIDRVCDAAWAQILVRHPGRDLEKNNGRQEALRKRLFILAKRGPVDFDVLRDRVLATMPETLMRDPDGRSFGLARKRSSRPRCRSRN